MNKLKIIKITVQTLWISIFFLLMINPQAYAIDRRAQRALGALLFQDPKLSGNNKMSCSSCHDPDKGYTDGLKLARGNKGHQLRRHTMTLLHSADQPSFNWDGRIVSLPSLILDQIENPKIMDQKMDHLILELSADPDYVILFNEIYGTPPSSEGITRALSSFLKTVVTKRAPFDRYLAGHKRAIPFQAQRGMELFQGKARCAKCHKGFNFTDSDIHNIGTPTLPGNIKDRGRFEVTGRKEDMGAFKTPTLRNIEQTGPYMHNGVFETLEEVVDFYADGGIRSRYLDKQMKPIDLTDLEKKELVLFMITLTGEIPTAKDSPRP